MVQKLIIIVLFNWLAKNSARTLFFSIIFTLISLFSLSSKFFARLKPIFPPPTTNIFFDIFSSWPKASNVFAIWEELINTYSIFEEQQLIDAVIRIKKRLGPQRTKIAIESIKKKDWKSVCTSVLEYYDKCYEYEKMGKNNIKIIDMTDIVDEKQALKLIKDTMKFK